MLITSMFDMSAYIVVLTIKPGHLASTPNLVLILSKIF